MERVLKRNQSKCPWHSFMCSVAPENDQLPLMLSCWCSIDVLMIFFFVSSLYTDPHEHFNSNIPGQLFDINLSLFYIKYYLYVRTRLKRYFKFKFSISFLIFGPIFGTQGMITVCFMLAWKLLLLVQRVLFSKLLIIFCNVFLRCPFSQNILVRYSISSIKHFSEQILVALARNPLNMLVIVSVGIQQCGFICTFVRDGLR